MTQRYLPIIALLLPALWAANAVGAGDSGIDVSEPPAIAGASQALPAGQPAAPAPAPASSSGFLRLPEETDAGQPAAQPQAPAAAAVAPQPVAKPASQAPLAGATGNNAMSLPDTTDNDTEAAEPSELPIGGLPAGEAPVKLPDSAGGIPPVPEGAAPPAPPPAEENQPEANTIALQGLNKVTGHISRIEAPIGTVMRFGNLEIIGRRCWKSPADEQPENAGLLEIWELKPGESHQRIFLGWMFASSPGLSGLEHPVYDVTMIECMHVDDSQKNAPAPETAKEAAKEPAASDSSKADSKPEVKPAKAAAKKAPAKAAH